MNGFWERVAFAFRCFFSILFHADIPNDIAQKLVKRSGPVPQAATVAAPSVSRLKEAERPASEAFDRAVQMLALLQRDGRLIDFLAENNLRLSRRADWSRCPHHPRHLPTGARPVCKAGPLVPCGFCANRKAC
jgi:hypothetical protein